MARLLQFSLPVLLAMTIFSCSRKSEESFLPGAKFTIVAPAPGATYHYGDTIYVQATINGSEQLHGYEVAMKAAGSTDNLYFQHHHEHANPLQVVESWKNTLTQPTEMILEISAILDDQAHKKTQTVSFRIGN